MIISGWSIWALVIRANKSCKVDLEELTFQTDNISHLIAANIIFLIIKPGIVFMTGSVILIIIHRISRYDRYLYFNCLNYSMLHMSWAGYRIVKHSSSDQSCLNNIIFLTGGCLSHQLIRPLHLLQRSSVLKALTLKNSILREPIINRLHVHSLVCFNVLYIIHYCQYKIRYCPTHLSLI